MRVGQADPPRGKGRPLLLEPRSNCTLAFSRFLANISLDLQAGSVWLLVAILVASIGFAIWTYRHTVPATTPAWRRTLIALRSLALATLLFAVFQPILNSSTTDTVRPEASLVLDRSMSMQLPQAGHIQTAGEETRQQAMMESAHAILTDAELRGPNRLPVFAVGEKSETFAGLIDSLKPTASVTDLASIFPAVREARRTTNTEALILYTDGAFTAGENPIYPAEQLGVPIFVVGLGDSSEARDIAVSELFTNEIAQVGATQPVDITVHYGGVHPGEHVLVELFEEQTKIGEQSVELKQPVGDIAVSFPYKPAQEGIKKLTARVSRVEGEASDKNNLRLAYVKVLRNKFKVTLFAGAPSSDVGFVKQFFENNPTYELKTYIQKKGSEYYEGTPDRTALSATDLVILVGFPIAATSDESVSIVRDLLTKGGKSLLFIPSRQLDYAKLATLGEALPFHVDARSASQNELKAGLELTSSAKDNPILRIPAGERSDMQWENLAPLFRTETHIIAQPESHVLAEAAVQGVKLGEPVLISRQLGTGRQIALTSYGIWQWRLTTFGREQAFRSQVHSRDSSSAFSPLDIFLSNSIRWLTTQEETKRVRIEPSRKFYQAGERIDFIGQVYDESYVPVEHAEVSARITGPRLTKPIDLTLLDAGNGRYSTSWPQGLPEGDYAYTGSAVRDGRTIGTDQGRFSVGEFNIEFAETRMRSDILRELAARTGGKFYTPATAASLMKDLESNPRFQAKEITNTHDYEIWNSWPLLAMSIVFFALEWLFRKRLGML
jgi:hypothetical protein